MKLAEAATLAVKDKTIVQELPYAKLRERILAQKQELKIPVKLLTARKAGAK